MINIDAVITNADWPKRTPDTFADLGLVKKREYVRDEKGRFAEVATITVGDRQISVVKPRRARSDLLVPLHVLPFDQRFAGDPNFYLGVGGGKNAIGDRYKRFGEFIASHDSIEASEVYVGDDGRVGFTNGRHRYAWLRDHGLTSIPVAMTPESVRNAKKFGYLAAVKMAWDESQQPQKSGLLVAEQAENKYKYGNTQIQIDPHSSAVEMLNTARNTIRDEHLMGAGKDVDPNHITVRYGLLNEDLDGLRAFIARQAPFEAYVTHVELFPASEHSDGAVPVVVRIASPDLRIIEEEIGKYADFKEKSFPEYKPHCTLAYVDPAHASKYADLPMEGKFLVHDIMISHQSGVKETIPFGMVQSQYWVTKRQWDESKHKRQPKGSGHGGEFAESVLHAAKDALDSLLNKETNISIQRDDLRIFIQLAGEQHEDPDLTDLQVEGMEIFGGNGLGIDRKKMPQIPRAHRERFLEAMEHAGVTITVESVDPLTLKPTQNEISARNVAEKLREYEADTGKEFPPLLVSKENRILDGHHHWGMMATLAVDVPSVKVPIYRLNISTKRALALMKVYMRENKIPFKSITTKADPATGRYVTPFVSFDKQGDDQLRMIASLNSSRLATWGFTAEAEVRGMARYKLTAVLDGRTSKFCRLIDGKIFQVEDAREKVIEALNVQNPEDLRVVQPWPKQTIAALKEFRAMTPDQLTALGFHIPPYHPYCRTICRIIEGSEGEEMEEVATVPEEAEVFQPVTQADLKELGVDATPEQVADWNTHIGMSPVELISKLTGMTPQEILTKGKGVGANPVQFDASGNIGIRAHGESLNGIEFKLGAILDPFTGIYYLSQAELLAGTPKAELAFLKNLFLEMINIGQKSTATSVAVGVAGNAAYYAKLGFLPDDLEWDSLRTVALSELETGALKPILASLSAEDALLVKQLLQDGSSSALSALVELPFKYQGKTVGNGCWGR